MKPSPTYPLSLFLSLLVFELASFAQGPAVNRANANVAGRVTVEGKPAPGVQVLLKERDGPDSGSGPTASPAVTAITNADGQYRTTNLPAGTYRISVYAPAYVIEGETRLSYEYGKTVTVAEGEEIGNLDFSLVRGGVLTGKVTDEYGKPVIAEGVGAFRIDGQGRSDNAAAGEMLRWQTDDRGVYRIFGLEPGRYVVGVGASSEDALQPTGNRGSYKRTYHPDAIDESSAKIIEVKPGGEVENLDIKLSHATSSYRASGRVIDPETGKPLPGVMIGCEIARTAGSSFRMGNTMTDSNGEFRIEGLSPNTYTAYVFNPGQSDLYSDQVSFDVADGNVTGLEIKMIRGASISGIAEVAGTRDPSVLARVSQVALRAEGASQDAARLMMTLMQGGGMGTINSGGTFRIGGVRPGLTRIVALPPPEVKGFTLARLERNGVEIKELDVAQGEQITGVRLVFTYGTSVLAGHVEIKGALPLNAQMTVRIVREGASPEEWWFAKQANVDARGQFSIEGLSQGNYKVYLLISPNDAGSQSNFPRIEQSVFIPDGARQEITLILDLTKGSGK
jgi:5-hydroxyisourate hydrolase-like protein (transthyretin family)